VVSSTPVTRSNTDCVPQKQPPANTAVCFPGVWAKTPPVSGGGIGDLLAALHPREAENAKTKITRVLRTAKERYMRSLLEDTLY
jgi:hypothetical protein